MSARSCSCAHRLELAGVSEPMLRCGMFRRALSLMALALLLPASSIHAEEKEKLSALSKITVLDKKEDVTVTVLGSRAPDFTSFTMSNPFRVVVDWAGSRIEGAANAEQKFPKGLI